MRRFAWIPLALCACTADDVALDEPAPAPVVTPDAAAPPPDAAPPDAAPLPAWLVGRAAPGEHTSCGDPGATPILPDERPAAARVADPDEEDGSIDRTEVDAPGDSLRLGRPSVAKLDLITLTNVACLLDSDGDGWTDGPCNERRTLVVERIRAVDEQEDIGDDELYLVADDTRHPHGDMDGYWNLNDGETVALERVIATRTRGKAKTPLALARVEGWEDDFEIVGDWSVDDHLFAFDVDLDAHDPGVAFTVRKTEADWDYEITLRVDSTRFSDPTPLEDADGDHDGISESREHRVAAELGGLADPERADIFVELDWMRGHALRTEGKRQVVTQYRRHGMALHIFRDDELAVDSCLTVPEAKTLYADSFDHKEYGAFRYAIIGEELWNARSGVAWGDWFFVDDSTWWINGWILPQAATFIHELGHTVSLTKDKYERIDSVAWLTYDSAMNYLFQATKVDYSSDGFGGESNDHDDWAAVEPAYGIRFSFALVKSTETGSCR